MAVADQITAQPLAQPGTLILVRHGRPSLARDVSLSWRGYRDWWAAYGQAGLAHGQTPPDKLVRLAELANLIVSSTLPRARETAEAIAPYPEDIVSDAIFIEAPLPSPPIPFVRFSPGVWGAVSRIAWWLGYAAGGESHGDAKRRAEAAADRLIELANGHELVVLCAHGWFNRMLRGVLRRRGWKVVYDGGDSYWGWRRLEPR